MRNIFDQYLHPENRLTHGLVCALCEDRKLLNNFVRWVTGVSPPKGLSVVEQQLPGESELNEDEAEKRELPDAWLYNNENWSLIIESKVSVPLKNDQLKRHYNTALRRGFDNLTLLAIDVVYPKNKLPDYVVYRKCSEIYSWLCKQAKYSPWALRTLRYMEIAESKWSADGYLKEGTLTVFSGIPFNEDNPYNYNEAK